MKQTLEIIAAAMGLTALGIIIVCAFLAAIALGVQP